jgi:hypothetical protein
MSNSTNILKAIVHFVQVEEAAFTLDQNYQNRIQAQGEKLEAYIKRLFSLSLNDNDLDSKVFKLTGRITGDESDIDQKTLRKFHGFFSWLGSKNHPPDLKLRNGDCVEIKKIGKKSSPFSGIELNSSPPRAKMKKDDPKIRKDMKTCEEGWTESDVLYVIGVEAKQEKSVWEHIWMFYGDTLFDDQVFESVSTSLYNPIKQMLDELETEIGFSNGETNELGRLNDLGINNLSNLRIRGMYEMKALNYLTKEGIIDKSKKVCAVMRDSKYLSFPDEDRANLEDCQDKGLLNIEESKLPDPIEAGKDIGIKIISVNQ